MVSSAGPTDGMTGSFYRFDVNFLGAVASRIVNEANGVDHLGHDETAKPRRTIKLE
jgi:GMP synthase (glutamine-hydrolysing)